jgi:hypothetical protein
MACMKTSWNGLAFLPSSTLAVGTFDDVLSMLRYPETVHFKQSAPKILAIPLDQAKW